jgi:hypothetical protein
MGIRVDSRIWTDLGSNPGLHGKKPETRMARQPNVNCTEFDWNIRKQLNLSTPLVYSSN